MSNHGRLKLTKLSRLKEQGVLTDAKSEVSLRLPKREARSLVSA